MSSKLLASALAAPLALAAIGPGVVLAQNAESHQYAYRYQYHHAYGYQPQPYGYDLPPSRGARGSHMDPHFETPAARAFQTDPDRNVRFELNRDANRGRN